MVVAGTNQVASTTLPLESFDAPPRRAMPSTSPSLLERLKDPDQQLAWERFVDLYTPLIWAWTRKMGLQEADAADLTQDVLCTLARVLPTFEYASNGSFRAWLRTVTINKWRERARRAQLPLEPSADHYELEHPSPDDPVRDFWDHEYQDRLTARALQLMQAEFQPTTWKAFWNVVVLEQSGASVAAELGLSVAAVYAAKSRVLRRLRTELSGLID